MIKGWQMKYLIMIALLLYHSSIDFDTAFETTAANNTSTQIDIDRNQ